LIGGKGKGGRFEIRGRKRRSICHDLGVGEEIRKKKFRLTKLEK